MFNVRKGVTLNDFSNDTKEFLEHQEYLYHPYYSNLVKQIDFTN